MAIASASRPWWSARAIPIPSEALDARARIAILAHQPGRARMPQVLDRFRSSTRGWLIGTLAGWGTIFLLLVGAGSTFYFLAQGVLHGKAWVGPLVLFGGLGILACKSFGHLGT